MSKKVRVIEADFLERYLSKLASSYYSTAQDFEKEGPSIRSVEYKSGGDVLVGIARQLKNFIKEIEIKEHA